MVTKILHKYDDEIDTGFSPSVFLCCDALTRFIWNCFENGFKPFWLGKTTLQSRCVTIDD
jgi:hypothetical protein